MMLEAAVHPAASFVTLTYKELPDGGNLVPRDLQLWIKSYREILRKKGECGFRYFAVGEYGDYSQRPHYHLAIFGRGMEDGELVKKTWKHGFTMVGTLTLSSAAYVAGYVTKKMTAKDDPRLHGRYPEFARMSLRPGIGAPAIHAVAEALQNKHGWDEINRNGDVPSVLRSAGRTMPLGRYMRARLREELGFKFRSDNPEKAFKKTAELLDLYKDYLLNTEAPVSLEKWEAARKAQKILKMEVKQRIYSQRSAV